MKNKILFIFSIIVISLFSGCMEEPKVADYSLFLKNHPKSILVVMPTNESLEVKASSSILANAILPLSEAGYYVFPPALVNETFKKNGIYEASEIKKVSLQKLKDIFGADAVLFMNVKKYGSNYHIISSTIEIEVEAKLVDLNTKQIIWHKTSKYVNSSADGGGGLAGLLIKAVVSQIVNETTDQAYNSSKIATSILFNTNCNDCILHGIYSPNFKQDSQLK